MPDFSNLPDAIAERDANLVRSVIMANEFVVIGLSDSDDDDQRVGALTAEVGDFEVLVAFTSQENASVFVGEMGDLFEDEEGVDGVIVEGDALLDCLPSGFGLLIDPESDGASIIDPPLAAEIIRPAA